MQVWSLDAFGSKNLAGYAFINVPSTPGSHEIETSLWRPVGTHREEMAAFFLDETTHLLSHELLHNPVKAKEDRNRLTTQYVGKIHLRLDIILRNLKGHKVET